MADHPDEPSAVVGARAMWILHCFDPSVPVQAGTAAAERALVTADALEA